MPKSCCHLHQSYESHKNGHAAALPLQQGGGVRRTPLTSLSICFLLVLFPGPPLPCPLLLGWALPCPSLLWDFMLKTFFHLSSLPHNPSPKLGTAGALPDTSAPVSLVESHHRDCWAGLKRGTPWVLPPPAVTGAAASALPCATCSPLTSSSSSFPPSSSLGCGQTQRVSGIPGSPQPLSTSPSEDPTGSSREARSGHCPLHGGMIPSIKGPPCTMQHPEVPCPCPPSLFLLPAQGFMPQHRGSGTQAEVGPGVPSHTWSVGDPPKVPSSCSKPMGTSRGGRVSAPHGAVGPFQQPLVCWGAALTRGCFRHCHRTGCFTTTR